MPPRICLPQPGTSPNAIHAPLPTWSPRFLTFWRDWTRASSKDLSNACEGHAGAELAFAAIPHLLPQTRRLSRRDAGLPPGSTADHEIGATSDARGAGRWAFEETVVHPPIVPQRNG